MQVAFAIDERLSSEHEQDFASANGVKKLRILENIKDSECNKLAEDICNPVGASRWIIIKGKFLNSLDSPRYHQGEIH
ncbi:MAG: hypothetical protein RIG63_18825 [Coleofasciculus chthonoplastes F3-SA18-01]|uniref:hypothetical protein n=1 Tax=Coleofasciculus chthonoplastes TaxID=64178 RepID=UPI0032F84DDC